MDLLKNRTQRTAVAAAGAVVLAVVVLFVFQAGGASAPSARQVHVSIRGNMGGGVSVDGAPMVRLDAYDGTDSRDFTAHASVTVTVTSTGEPPRCHITAAGRQLADETGPVPSTIPQTMGYGASVSVLNAPTMETVTCSATLSS